MRLIKSYIFIGVFFLLSNCLKVEANILVLNGLTHEQTALQGEIKAGVIELKNIAKTAQSVQLYQRDYWYSHTGENRHDEPGTLARSNAKWIKVNPVFITLQPNETTEVQYEITVPSIDSLTGTYWSVIMVEGLAPPDTTENTGGIKINTVVRYAIQIITNIGNTGDRNLSFLNFDLSKPEGGTELSIDIKNVGQRVLRPEMSIEVYDAEGQSIGVFKADRRRVYPGTSAKILLDLSSLENGMYSGVLIADCGDDYVFGSNLSLEIKNE